MRQACEEVRDLVMIMGHDGRKYRREANQRLGAVVSEVYSAPRVTEAARRYPRLGCIPRFALDLTSTDDQCQAWNFDVPEMRWKAERLLEEQRPTLLIGSPMCTPFSNLQNLNKAKRDPATVMKEKDAARLHFSWCCRLYAKQMAMGGYFLQPSRHPGKSCACRSSCGRMESRECWLTSASWDSKTRSAIQ